MTTNATIISDALRLCGVVAEGQSVSTEQSAHALRRLNQMLEQWTEDGIELGYFEQSSTSDACPIPKWAERGVTSRLAMDLHSTYPSGSLTSDVTDDAKNGYGTIVRKIIVEGLKPMDMSHLPRGTGSLGEGGALFDIATGDVGGESTWG